MDEIIAFKRPHDGEIFSINPDGTFSLDMMKKDFPNSLRCSYSREKLEQCKFIPIYKMKNKLTLIIGPSGSGKSTLAKKLAAQCCICEADQYWLNCVGDYLFVPSKLGDAHKWCQNKVESLMKDGKSRIIVSNTSLNKKERQVYHDIAKRNDYDVEVVLPDSPWFLSVRPRLINKTFTDEDVNIFVQKSTHGVPFDAMKRMFLKYEED